MKRLLSALLFVSVLAGCGPLQSTSYLLDADVALQSAKTAGADKYAPYEYTAASLYLHKAREEVGYSDYEVAIDFAQKAAKFAAQAREKAMAAPKESAPPLPSTAP